MTAEISSTAGIFPCAISDVSPHGLRITATSATEYHPGDQVTVSSEKIGSVHGVVRWCARPRLGFELLNGETAPPPFVEYYESLSSQRVLGDRMKFLELDEAALASLRGAKPVLDRELSRGLDHFYDVVRGTPAVRALFAGEAAIQRAKAAQMAHWEGVASAAFDERYLEGVRRIGLAHERVGLEPRWYIGGYGLLAAFLSGTILRETWPKKRWSGGPSKEADKAADAVAAMIKAIFLEMDLVISVYLQEAEAARLKAEEAAISHERAMVLNSIGRSLNKLAEKNLAYRMSESLPVDYAKVQGDFNASIEYLDSALQRVIGTAGGVQTGMREIAAASEDLARRTEQQAANLEQTAAALGEIDEAARRTADGAASAHAAMEAAQVDAEHSGEVVRKTVTTMNRIAESSQAISQIINVVDEIAFQTNLLALNAGVEAARAGEFGRGFAVVASEVRTLAQRSGEAAKEIRDLIAASTAHVNDGVAQVAEAGAALERIAKQVTTINTGIADIARTAKEQAHGLRELNVAVDQLDTLTQQNAAMAEEATAAAVSVERETQHLAELVGEFKVSVSPRGTPQLESPAAPSAPPPRRTGTHP